MDPPPSDWYHCKEEEEEEQCSLKNPNQRGKFVSHVYLTKVELIALPLSCCGGVFIESLFKLVSGKSERCRGSRSIHWLCHGKMEIRAISAIRHPQRMNEFQGLVTFSLSSVIHCTFQPGGYSAMVPWHERWVVLAMISMMVVWLFRRLFRRKLLQRQRTFIYGVFLIGIPPIVEYMPEHVF